MKSAKFYCVGALTALLLIGAGGAVMANDGGAEDNSRVSRVNSTEIKEVPITNGDVGIDQNTGLITSFTNVEKARKLLAGGHLMIPAKINGTIVKGIGSNSVFDYNRLNSLIKSTKESQPKGRDMTRGNKNATRPGISAVTFAEPENIVTIGQWAFYGNQISTLSLPKVKYIGALAFYQNKIETLNLPEIENIGLLAFFMNHLTSVNLGAPETYNKIAIEELAFDQQFQYEYQMEGSWFLGLSEGSTQINIPYHNPIKWKTLIKAVNPSFKVNGTEQLDTEKAKVFKIESPKDQFNEEIQNDKDLMEITNIPRPSNPRNKFGIDVWYEPEGDEGKASSGLQQRTSSNISNLTKTGNYSIGTLVNITNPTTPPTTTPDPQPEREKQPETNNNNSGNTININPAPDLDFPHQSESVDKVAKHPHTIYNKQTIRVHKNTELTSPLKTYRKVARHKAKTFKVLGVAYSQNGVKRYKVAGGYVMAHKDYVANAHYQSVPKSKRVKVISTKGVYKYKDAKLTKRATTSHVKRAKMLKVAKLVKQGNLTRYQLSDGSYISTNKTLVTWSK